MEKERFLRIFENAVLVDEGTLSFNTNLDSLEDWDSLAIASLLSELEEIVGSELEATEINECDTIEEVYNIISSKINS